MAEDEKTYDVLDLEGNTELLVAGFSSLLPEQEVGRNSDNWKRLRTTAMGKTDLDANIAASFRDALPDTAGEATIGRHGETWGVARKGATPASAVDSGKVRGTVGSSWTTADTLTHKSGLQFRPTAPGTMGASEEEVIGVTAVDTGPETRLEVGEVLVWDATPAGLENEVVLVADLDDGGEDKEPIGPYRSRILNRIAQPAMGGNANDWKQWVIESADYIVDGYVWPNRNGRGSVDITGLREGSGEARLLTLAERDDLLDYVDSLRPVSSEARVLEVTAEALDTEIVVTPENDPQYAKDWDDSTPLVVSTWTPGTRTLVFTTARPASMAVGHRIVVDETSGVPMVIESLSSTDAVVVEDALGQTPVATELVYAGGPLTIPVRDAILALFDSLGPRVGDFGQGDWESTFRLSSYFETVQTTEGVLDSEPIAPVANVEPTAETHPDDAAVNMLVPGNVIVRYA